MTSPIWPKRRLSRRTRPTAVVKLEAAEMGAQAEEAAFHVLVGRCRCSTRGRHFPRRTISAERQCDWGCWRSVSSWWLRWDLRARWTRYLRGWDRGPRRQVEEASRWSGLSGLKTDPVSAKRASYCERWVSPGCGSPRNLVVTRWGYTRGCPSRTLPCATLGLGRGRSFGGCLESNRTNFKFCFDFNHLNNMTKTKNRNRKIPSRMNDMQRKESKEHASKEVVGIVT